MAMSIRQGVAGAFGRTFQRSGPGFVLTTLERDCGQTADCPGALVYPRCTRPCAVGPTWSPGAVCVTSSAPPTVSVTHGFPANQLRISVPPHGPLFRQISRKAPLLGA